MKERPAGLSLAGFPVFVHTSFLAMAILLFHEKKTCVKIAAV